MENINKPPNKDKQINKNINNDIKVHFSSNYEIKFKINEKTTLSEVRAEICQKYLIANDEYELFIGEKNIDDEPNSLHAIKLFEKYKTNVINIKTNKNIFDLQNQLNIYDNFLSKNISLKTEEINKLKEEIENLKKDLTNI